MERDESDSLTPRSLRHIAIWQKSSELCKSYHPGKPPCFFPSQFSASIKPQSFLLLPIFVQNCPSSKLYFRFFRQGKERSQNRTNCFACRTNENDFFLNNSQKMSSKLRIGRLEALCSSLSSIDSSLRLIHNPKLAIISPSTSTIASRNFKTSSQELHEKERINIYLLMWSNPTERSVTFAHFNVEGHEIESSIIDRFTNELREIIALISIEIEIWNYLTN